MSLIRLDNSTLSGLNEAVVLPEYDRSQVRPGIVHLGIGAFHRAHQAVYLDDCLAIDPGWGIIGASLRRPDTAEALNPQDGLYALAIRHDDSLQARIVGSVKEVLCEPGNGPVLDAIASPETRMVTLTVTEKAYCRNPATGQLETDHPGIRADLAQGSAATVPSLLTGALAKRYDLGLPPIAIVSCDNLPANGRTLANIVVQFAERRDPALARWIEKEISFPSTMVDRIVPATTDRDRSEISALIGCEDAWPVVTEPFSQWVVEDRFAAGRPPLEQVGVIMADDVEPFEHMKLRLLNGSHSALAYLGVLAGCETVADAVANPELRGYLSAMMHDEIKPTVNVPGVDLDAYIRSLLERFSNGALKHRTMQIAMDGSQKIPQRLLGTIRDRKAAGAPHDRLLLGVAAWIRHLSGALPDGSRYEIDDPMADVLAAIAVRTLPDVNGFGNAVLDLQPVFSDDLRMDQPFRNGVLDHLGTLFSDGVDAALRSAR